MTEASPTAAILVIGDEILSGRTQDTNVAAIARFLAPLGIDVEEVRFVPDREDDIVAALNALRVRYAYVFTTGGIGPTHDDITADAVSKAFGVAIDYHPEALRLLAARYGQGEFNARRQNMARIPVGASLIKNPVSVAPGFHIENVFVMAGVPRIMQAMLEDVGPRLKRGLPVINRSMTLHIPEGAIAEDLAAIQARHPAVSIGSYPFFAEGSRLAGTTLVVRGRLAGELDAAAKAIAQLAAALNIESETGPGTT
jgi:molybdenum cofactor synthesis domain-containing protein